MPREALSSGALAEGIFSRSALAGGCIAVCSRSASPDERSRARASWSATRCPASSSEFRGIAWERTAVPAAGATSRARDSLCSAGTCLRCLPCRLLLAINLPRSASRSATLARRSDGVTGSMRPGPVSPASRLGRTTGFRYPSRSTAVPSCATRARPASAIRCLKSSGLVTLARCPRSR